MDQKMVNLAVVLPQSTFKARRKAALDAVLKQINASDRKPTSFGPFSVVPERQLWSSLHNPQIRATCGEFHGAEFRAFFGLGNAGPVRRARIVDNVLEKAQEFVAAARSGQLSKPLLTAHQIAQRLTGGVGLEGGTMRVTAIGLYPCAFIDEVIMSFDIEMLGDDLQVGTENVAGWTNEMDQLHASIEEKVARNGILTRHRDELAAEGATWRIDETALRIADAARLTVAQVIGLLADGSNLQLRYQHGDDEPLPCSIRWSDGVLRGYVGASDGIWQCFPNMLTVRSLNLPATIIAAMHGRPLRALIEHPLIAADAIVVGWNELSGSALIALDMPSALVTGDQVARRPDGSVEWKVKGLG